MKTLLKFTFLFTQLLSGAVFSYEYSLKSAFCSDYASNKTRIYSKTYQYDYTVEFRKCMSQATELINKHEKNKEKKDLYKKQKRQKEIDKKNYLRLQEENKKRTLLENFQNLFK